MRKIYNPYQHAWELGLTVEWAPLSPDIRAYYDHESKTIYLREDLSVRVANCNLAHEIVHAEFGDTQEDLANPLYKAKAEKRCDKIAAQRLVVWPQLVKAIKTYDDPGAWCAELVTMPWVLENFFRDLTPQMRVKLETETGRDSDLWEGYTHEAQ